MDQPERKRGQETWVWFPFSLPPPPPGETRRTEKEIKRTCGSFLPFPAWVMGGRSYDRCAFSVLVGRCPGASALFPFPLSTFVCLILLDDRFRFFPPSFPPRPSSKYPTGSDYSVNPFSLSPIPPFRGAVGPVAEQSWTHRHVLFLPFSPLATPC